MNTPTTQYIDTPEQVTELCRQIKYAGGVTLSGAGSVSVTDVERIRDVGVAMLSGSGLIAAAAVNGAIHMGARLSGTGSLTVDLDQVHARSSNLSGHGSLVGTAGVIREVSARLSGRGSLAATAVKTNKKTYPAVLLIAT